MRYLTPAFCLLLLLATAACGSSGGGSPDTDAAELGAPLAGAFHVSGAWGNGVVVTGIGSPEPDGSFPAQVTVNRVGDVSDTPVEGAYESWPDGTVVSNLLLGPAVGSVTETGDVVALRNPGRSIGPAGLSVLLRRDETVAPDALAGTYRYVAMLLGPPDPLDPEETPVVMTSGGTLVFDASGGAELIPEYLNVDGVQTGTETEPALYTLGADGSLVLDLGITRLTGAVARGGELISLAGGTAADQDALVLYAVRQGTGFDDARLDGLYTALNHDGKTSGNFGFLGRMDCDGAGLADLEVGTGESFLAVAPWSYAVDADGRVDLSYLISGGGLTVEIAYEGAISSAGDVVIAASGVVDGQPPALLLLVRPDATPRADVIVADPLRSATLLDPVDIVGSPGVDLLAVSDGLRVGEASRIRPLLGDPAAYFGALRFDLRGIPAGARVATARLVTTQDEMLGNPFISLLGPIRGLLVRHVDFGRGLTRSDWNAPSRPAGVIGALSESPLPGERSLDVTEALRTDLADGRSTCDLLLLFGSRGNDNDEVDFVRLDQRTGPFTGVRTRLVITYE
ncbi:MAG: hypothetical protein QNJ90_04575 [Planctomycetota bacterium]|nr:hypothetical protein [Planctomycetota bacterium]